MKRFYNQLKQAIAYTAVALLCLPSVYAQQSDGAPVVDINGSDFETRLSLLERKVNNRAEMQHRLQGQIDTMQAELDELRGAVEVHTNQLQKVLDRQRELYLEIDKRVDALQSSGYASGGPSNAASGSSAESAETVDSPTSNSASATPAANVGLSEADAYEKAVNLILKSREYDLAIPEFQSFIARFPDSSYAPNAHYWLGQLLFNKQQWQEAGEQFDVVATKFVTSTKRADALLKLGVIAEKMGDPEKAKSLFEDVVNEYPNSSARKLAEARL